MSFSTDDYLISIRELHLWFPIYSFHEIRCRFDRIAWSEQKNMGFIFCLAWPFDMIGKPPDLERKYPTQIIVSRLHVKLPPSMRCNRRLHCRVVHVSQWIQHFLVGGLRLYSFSKIVPVSIIIPIYFQVSFLHFPFILCVYYVMSKRYEGIQVFKHKLIDTFFSNRFKLQLFLSRSGSKLWVW